MFSKTDLVLAAVLLTAVILMGTTFLQHNHDPSLFSPTVTAETLHVAMRDLGEGQVSTPPVKDLLSNSGENLVAEGLTSPQMSKKLNQLYPDLEQFRPPPHLRADCVSPSFPGFPGRH